VMMIAGTANLARARSRLIASLPVSEPRNR
jgi:hypothetical protein